MQATEKSRSLRRPMRSASGISRNAGSEPSRVMLVKSPSSPFDSPKLSAIWGRALPSTDRS